MKSITRAVVAALAATTIAGTAIAAGNTGPEGTNPVRGIAHLDHVFLIMMENHAYSQVIGNPNMPFFNGLAKGSNLATNYFAVGHPSLTNYLEIVGGSNFGVRNDNSPAWHAGACAPGYVYLEGDSKPICPLAASGTDAATPAIDSTNEDPGFPTIDVDGTVGFAAQAVLAKTIADQLVARGLSWKAYEESLPPSGADGVNSADGLFSNLNLVSNNTNPASSTYNGGLVFNGTLQSLYAVKHNPFAYFANIQSGADPRSSMKNTVGFDGPRGLFEDLASGRVPNLVFIAPNQCNDQHGRSGASAGPSCDFDHEDNGTLTGLNPALMYLGDVALERIVGAIKSSPAWNRGTNAIVIVWDENDYSIAPTTNQVALIVDTNEDEARGQTGHASSQFYTAFSLLKTLEGGFGLPCLNHACDQNVSVMDDLFPSHGGAH